jgi:hypothetical protein
MTSLTLARGRESRLSGEQLLRLDVRGRVRTGRDRREQLLSEYDRSGVSGARFARMAGIKYATFAGWLHQRRRKAAGVRGSRRVTWVEAAVKPPPVQSAALRVELPGGAWMELTPGRQMSTAVQLLKELAKEGGAAC